MGYTVVVYVGKVMIVILYNIMLVVMLCCICYVMLCYHIDNTIISCCFDIYASDVESPCVIYVMLWYAFICYYCCWWGFCVLSWSYLLFISISVHTNHTYKILFMYENHILANTISPKATICAFCLLRHLNVVEADGDWFAETHDKSHKLLL